MLMIWEEIKRKRNSKENPETNIEAIVLQYMSTHPELQKVHDAARLTNTLTKLLSDERLCFPTTKMLEECGETLQSDAYNISRLKKLWRDLSAYQQFTHVYIETIIRNTHLCSWEQLDDQLFKQTFDFYFSVMDYFYATLAQRFENLRDKIYEICYDATNNSTKEFKLARKILDIFSWREKRFQSAEP